LSQTASSDRHLLVSQSIECDEKLSDEIHTKLEGAYRVRPNRRFIGITWRLWAYKLIRPDAISKSKKKREERNKEPGGLRYGIREVFGEPPSYYNNEELYRTSLKMVQVLNQEGYLQARVTVNPDSSHISGWGAVYNVNLGIRWNINDVIWNFTTSGLPEDVIREGGVLKTGSPLSVSDLHDERERISKLAGNLGFATFNEGFIKFELDTFKLDGGVNVEILLRGQRIEGTSATIPHKSMKIGSVFFDQSEMTKPLKTSILTHLVTLEEGAGFDPAKFESSYRRLSGVSALKVVEIKKDFPVSHESNFGVVDVTVEIQDSPRYDIAIEFDMTRADTRYGPLGKFTWSDRNATGRGDVLTWTISAAVASTQPFSYNSSSIIPNSGEFSFLWSYRTIGMPPKRLESLPKSTAPHSEWVIQAARESRPEYSSNMFDYRHRIEWTENPERRSRVMIDIIQLSYVNLNISDDFAEWLEIENNEILKLRFSDYALTGSRIGWTSLIGSSGGNMALGFEWSGMASKYLSPFLGWKVSEEGEVTIGEVPIVKFIRIDGSWVISNNVSNREDIVFASRVRFGRAFVGEGTEALPYSKGFFGGGLNGVRGWPIRELGPGNYSEDSSSQGILRGVGDSRLEISSEFRIKWSSLTTIAVFADAGNIWQNETGQNDGTSWGSSGLSSIAFGAGVGLRLDFEFFLVRLDAALRLHDPTHTDGERWIFESRPNGALHLGLGHPF
jgi:hypothetical protein